MQKRPPLVGIVRHQQFLRSETFIVSQASALRGFQPLYIGRDPVPDRPGVRSVSVSQFGRRDLLTYTLTRRSAGLRRALADADVALLHAHFGVEGVYAANTAKALNLPLVTSLHGFDVTLPHSRLLASKKPSWVNYVAWRQDLFSRGAVFVCVSEFVRRKAIEWGYPAERTVVLPIGVDVDLIRPTASATRPRVVHVARLVEVKGTAYLLRAFAHVLAAIPDADLVIVGDGPLRGQLESLSAELGIAGSVQFTGAAPHERTLAELGQARVLCLPSITASTGAQEGLGMVLLEAAAAGKPLVGTDCGGIPEAVLDGVTGFLVPEKDAGSLAERLIELLRDPDMCERFGKAGRDMVTDRYNLQRQTAALESLYRTLI